MDQFQTNHLCSLTRNESEHAFLSSQQQANCQKKSGVILVDFSIIHSVKKTAVLCKALFFKQHRYNNIYKYSISANTRVNLAISKHIFGKAPFQS